MVELRAGRDAVMNIHAMDREAGRRLIPMPGGVDIEGHARRREEEFVRKVVVVDRRGRRQEARKRRIGRHDVDHGIPDAAEVGDQAALVDHNGAGKTAGGSRVGRDDLRAGVNRVVVPELYDHAPALEGGGEVVVGAVGEHVAAVGVLGDDRVFLLRLDVAENLAEEVGFFLDDFMADEEGGRGEGDEAARVSGHFAQGTQG